MFRIFISILIFLFVFSCSKEIKIEDIGFTKSFKIAKKKFKNENYLEAINDFNTIILNYGGENGIDSAQFYLAKSHFELEEYYSSSYEYIRLAESFPESKLVEDSYFNSAECYRQLSPPYTLEQKETLNAISKYQTYLDLFPNGSYSKEASERISELRNKLAQKEYEAGILYMKMDQPRAAKVYFLGVIDNYYDTNFYISSIEQYANASLAMNDEYNYQLYIKKFNELKDKIK